MKKYTYKIIDTRDVEFAGVMKKECKFHIQMN